MRAVVVGAAGSLGTQVCADLLDKGWAVLGSDLDENGLARLARIHAAQVSLTDLRDFEGMRQVIEAFNPGVVINCAAMKHVMWCEQHPLRAVETNIVANLRLLQIVRGRPVQLIYISSDKAIKPRSVYALTKQFSDHVLLSEGQHIVRGVNFLNSAGSVLDIWRRQWMDNRPFTVVADDCARYFIRVEDMSRLVLSAIGSAQHEHFPKKVWRIPIRRLFDSFLRVAGVSGREIKQFDLPATEKHHEDLDFSPEVLELSGAELDRVVGECIQPRGEWK